MSTIAEDSHIWQAVCVRHRELPVETCMMPRSALSFLLKVKTFKTFKRKQLSLAGLDSMTHAKQETRRTEPCKVVSIKWLFRRLNCSPGAAHPGVPGHGQT